MNNQRVANNSKVKSDQENQQQNNNQKNTQNTKILINNNTYNSNSNSNNNNNNRSNLNTAVLPNNNEIINTSQNNKNKFNQINTNKQNTQNNSNEENKIIPRAPVSDYTYQDFIKILKAYLKELKELNITNSKLSQEDVLVINDLISEANQYIVNLIAGFILEAQDVLDLSEKIVSAFFLVFKNLLLIGNQNNSSVNETNSESVLNTNKLLTFPFVLKLSLLEVKFQFYVNYYIQEKGKIWNNSGNNNLLTNLIDECETVVYDIITIQEKLGLGTYSVACSKFYLSIVNFFKKSYQDCITLCKEAIEILESKSLKNEKAKLGNGNGISDSKYQSNLVGTGSSNIISTTDNLISHDEEFKDISKLVTITDFLAQVYELLKE
jgi:hypothetical protein